MPSDRGKTAPGWSGLRAPAWRKTFEAAHLTAVGVWLGALLLSAAAAMVTFPAVREMAPSLGAYEKYPGDHAALAGGLVQNEVFKVLDVTQFLCGLVALSSMIGLLTVARLPTRRWSSAVRLVGLGLAMGLVSYHLLVLAPRMDQHLKSYYHAASAGQMTMAADAKAAFDKDHPVAENVLATLAVTLLITQAAAAFSAASGGLATATGAVARAEDLEAERRHAARQKDEA